MPYSISDEVIDTTVSNSAKLLGAAKSETQGGFAASRIGQPVLYPGITFEAAYAKRL